MRMVLVQSREMRSMVIKLSGISIKTGANPTVKNNKVRNGLAGGVLTYQKGLGTPK